MFGLEIISLFTIINIIMIIIFVPTFENGIIMLGVVFLFSQSSAIEIIVFDKKILRPIEDIDFLKSKLKRSNLNIAN